MATELARKIRGTRITIGRQVRNLWVEAQNIECEVLVFGDIGVGDQFISFPMPGDNSGHGGFLNGSYLFKKIDPLGDACEPLAPTYYNAMRLVDGTLSHMPNSMWVYKIH